MFVLVEHPDVGTTVGEEIDLISTTLTRSFRNVKHQYLTQTLREVPLKQVLPRPYIETLNLPLGGRQRSIKTLREGPMNSVNTTALQAATLHYCTVEASQFATGDLP